jgi:hypothetical protein
MGVKWRDTINDSNFRFGNSIVLTLEDWRNKSIKGEVCAIPGCQFIPNSSQCPIFFVHYCYEHLKSHLHPVTAMYGSLSSQRQ